MKDKVLSVISLITVFIPITMLFVWRPTASIATSIAIGYGIFILISFAYALILFCKKQLRNIYVKLGLAINTLYIVGIFGFVVIPRLF